MIGSLKHIFFIIGIFSGNIIFYQGYENLEKNKTYDFKLSKPLGTDNTIKQETDNLVNVDLENNLKFLEKEKIDDKKNNLFLQKKEILVTKGQTFSSILRKTNLSESKIYQIIIEIEKYFDLKLLKINQKIIFLKDKNF